MSFGARQLFYVGPIITKNNNKADEQRKNHSEQTWNMTRDAHSKNEKTHAEYNDRKIHTSKSTTCAYTKNSYTKGFVLVSTTFVATAVDALPFPFSVLLHSNSDTGHFQLCCSTSCCCVLRTRIPDAIALDAIDFIFHKFNAHWNSVYGLNRWREETASGSRLNCNRRRENQIDSN